VIVAEAHCPGIDPKTTEFTWYMNGLDKAGNMAVLWRSPTIAGASRQRLRFAEPGAYEISLVYRPKGVSTYLTAAPLPINAASAAPLNVSLNGKTKLEFNERSPMIVRVNDGVPPYRITVSVEGGGSRSGSFTRQTQFFAPAGKPGDEMVTVAVADAKGNTFARTIGFFINAAGAPPIVRNGVDPLVGSYSATVTGAKPPDTNKYWAHVVGADDNGTRHISLYAHGDNYHISLYARPNDNVSVSSGEYRFPGTASGKGSVAGNGAIGTAITLQWTLTGSDGKPTPYTWVLTKYDNRDLGGPQPGFSR
jgi:hypothetical protein